MTPFIVVLFAHLMVLCNALPDCDDALRNEQPFTGSCSNKWKNLKPLIRPTQQQVGFAWIQYKYDSKFNSPKAAQDEIDSSPTPAVIGPGPAYYIVDDHHTLCSLDLSGYTEVSVVLNVLCDKRNMPVEEFWIEMSQQNLAYLAAHPTKEPNALPIEISHLAIPAQFDFTEENRSFSDDPWRALAGFSRKVTKVAAAGDNVCNTAQGDNQYCERCMFRGCSDGYQNNGSGVSYFEFRWAYFMNDAFFRPDLWDSLTEYTAFKTAYSALPMSAVGKVNTDDWFAAAQLIIPLCRGKAGRVYQVNSHLYPGSDFLPGYYQGYIKLGGDPSCNKPVCK